MEFFAEQYAQADNGYPPIRLDAISEQKGDWVL